MFRHLLEMPRSNRWALLPVIILATSGIYELRGAHEQKTSADHSPVEVTVRTKPRPGLRVVSGGLVYEEDLYKGGLRTRYWSPTGLIKPETFLERAGEELPALDEPIACSFGLSVDGQDLWDSWSWRSAEELACAADNETRLAAEHSRKCRHEYGLSYVGFMSPENYRYGDTDFRFRGQMFGHLCLGGLAPSLRDLTAAQRDRVRHDVELYKSFIRPILPTVRVYHHTPILPSTEPGEWCVWEHVTPDRTRGYAGIFRLAGAKGDAYILRPRGLDVSKTYKVTFDNSNSFVPISGLELERDGLRVRIGQPLRSELLLFEAQ